MCETFYGCSFKAAVTAELILKIVKINEINETSISLVSIHWYKFFIFLGGGVKSYIGNRMCKGTARL